MKLPVRLDHRFIYDADGKPIAMIAPTDNAAAVVASIVRAVNSHADLVAALEAARECILTEFETTKTITAIDAALAKAKSHDSRCPHCLGVCNPLHDGSGFCDKCQGTGHAKTKED